MAEIKYAGYLLKFGSVVLPNSFLLADGWKSKPNQRVDIEAYRDANVLLHRETSANYKTQLTFNVRSMNLIEKMAFNEAINQAIVGVENNRQRRVKVTYWNDEINDYKTGVFYIPDIEYTIHTTNDKPGHYNVYYKPFQVKLIEY